MLGDRLSGEGQVSAKLVFPYHTFALLRPRHNSAAAKVAHNLSYGRRVPRPGAHLDKPPLVRARVEQGGDLAPVDMDPAVKVVQENMQIPACVAVVVDLDMGCRRVGHCAEKVKLGRLDVRDVENV